MNIQWKFTIKNSRFLITDYCTVLQAELTAIQRAVKHIASLPQKANNAKICNDLLSALLAIGDRCNSSPIVTDTKNALLLDNGNDIEILIKWVKKAHVGIEKKPTHWQKLSPRAALTNKRESFHFFVTKLEKRGIKTG